ncbi:hypothetical protein JHK87_033232 [Glycine soja]|nr:hypothetical protein JHK87_033232 [Glycine soja]
MSSSLSSNDSSLSSNDSSSGDDDHIKKNKVDYNCNHNNHGCNPLRNEGQHYRKGFPTHEPSSSRLFRMTKNLNHV